ncbi:MAG: OmpH family outer membrane protein [Proteobacteria bacterium]|nr:OmpH family outer membrane protein [Pseudomonadota bacterium]
MKFGYLRTIFVVAFSMLCLFSSQANAQINIAVIDIDLILVKSKAAESVKNQVEEKRKSFLKDIKIEEDKLRVEQKSLEKKLNELSKEEFLKQRQGFENRRLVARKKIQNKKQELEKAYSKSMNVLTKSIYDVCQKIALEDKIDLIITRQNIVVGSMSLDITKKAMDRLNKKLPILHLKVK